VFVGQQRVVEDGFDFCNPSFDRGSDTAGDFVCYCLNKALLYYLGRHLHPPCPCSLNEVGTDAPFRPDKWLATPDSVRRSGSASEIALLCAAGTSELWPFDRGSRC